MPLKVLIDNPAGLTLYVPPEGPVRVTLTPATVVQNGEPAYVIVALCCELMATFNDCCALPQLLLTTTVYVPAAKVDTEVMAGFCAVEAKPFGPVQA